MSVSSLYEYPRQPNQRDTVQPVHKNFRLIQRVMHRGRVKSRTEAAMHVAEVDRNALHADTSLFCGPHKG